MKLRDRRPSGFVCLGFSVLSILVLLALACPLPAQQVSLTFAQGTHLFRRILHDLNLRPLRSFADLQEPADKLLIVLGETKDLKTRLQLRQFVEQGGALLLATDRECRDVLEPFGVGVVGSLVKVEPHSPYAYKQSDDCIFVQPSGKDSPLFENLSVEKKVSRVATNRPGYLLTRPMRDCNLKLLATFPPGCFPTELGYLRRRNWVPLSFAVGGDYGQGRILVLSDHSVFINAMMWQPDIENFDFAYNCVNWLTQGGKRQEVLFLEEGEIQKTFEIPLRDPPAPPLPPLKAIVEAVDKGLGELESDNWFNRLIQSAVTRLTPPRDIWLRTVLLTATSLLGLFALARLSQARHRPQQVAALASSTRPQTPPPSLLDLRHRSMTEAGNYWEAARALARQGLDSILGVSVPGSPPPEAGSSWPSLKVQGGWWRNWRLRRRIQRLWQLAYGTEPVRITSRQLKHLGPEIEYLKVVLARSASGKP